MDAWPGGTSAAGSFAADAVFDRHQHRSPMVVNDLTGDRRRPMHRRCKVEARGSLRFPAHVSGIAAIAPAAARNAQVIADLPFRN